MSGILCLSPSSLHCLSLFPLSPSTIHLSPSSRSLEEGDKSLEEGDKWIVEGDSGRREKEGKTVEGGRGKTVQGEKSSCTPKNFTSYITLRECLICSQCFSVATHNAKKSTSINNYILVFEAENEPLL
jgi:hypothetical protein